MIETEQAFRGGEAGGELMPSFLLLPNNLVCALRFCDDLGGSTAAGGSRALGHGSDQQAEPWSEVVDERERRRTLLGSCEQQPQGPRCHPGRKVRHLCWSLSLRRRSRGETSRSGRRLMTSRAPGRSG